MKKIIKNILRGAIVLIFVLIFGLFIIGFFVSGGSGGLLTPPPIPSEGKEGLKTGSIRRLGYLDLSTKQIPDKTYLSLFTGKSLNGDKQIRAFITSEKQQLYLGPLTTQFNNSPIQTLFFDTGGDKFIVGYVSPSVKGHLLYFEIDRPEPDTSKWMKAVKESKINKARIFLVPIFQDEANKWNKLDFVGIETKETLRRGVKTDDSYYIWEQSFKPSLDIQSWFISIPIEKN